MTQAEPELRRLELERLRRPARTRLRRGRAGPSRIRSSSCARTASMTAAAPSTAGRSTTPCASRSRRAGCGSRPMSAGIGSRATSWTLPDGVYYGRVGASDAWPLARVCAARAQIHLPLLPRALVLPFLRCRPRQLAVREQTGLRSVARRAAASGSSGSARAGAVRLRGGWNGSTRSALRRGAGRADAPHVLDRGAQAPESHVA